MANVVEIVLNGRADGLTSAFRTAQNAFNEFTNGMRTGNAAAAVFNSAISLTSDVLVQSVSNFVDYSNEVEKLSRLTGMNAEDTSRMIQVADDLRISYGELSTAMRFAAKNGIEPNIENIARLSDEYLKLNPGQERAAFLMENFGRAGVNMGKLMEQGSVNLMKMNGAIDKNLILTDEAIQRANEYQKAIDDLDDSWAAVTNQIGYNAIPKLTALAKWIDEHKQGLVNVAEYLARVFLPVEALFIDSLGETETAFMSTSEAVRDQQSALEDNSDAVKDLAVDYKDLLGLTESIAEESKSYNDTIAELTGKQEDLAEAMKNTTDPQEIKNLQDEYDAYGDKIEEVTKKHEAATQRMLYDLFVQKLAVDGLTDAEFEMATGYAEAAGIIDKKSATSARAINNVANKLVGTKLSSEQMATAMKIAFDKGEAAAMKYIASLNKIPTKITTLTVSAGGPTSGGVSTGGGSTLPKPTAQGDYVQAGDVLKVGEVGPELFVPSSNGRIVPNDQMGKSGVTNNYMYGTFIVQGSGGALDITGVR